MQVDSLSAGRREPARTPALFLKVCWGPVALSGRVEGQCFDCVPRYLELTQAPQDQERTVPLRAPIF